MTDFRVALFVIAKNLKQSNYLTTVDLVNKWYYRNKTELTSTTQNTMNESYKYNTEQRCQQ